MATKATTAERLTLRLAVGMPGRPLVPLELDAPADATVGAAAEALAHELGADADELLLQRTGRRLRRSVELREAGLRHGDRLLFTGGAETRAPRRQGSSAELELAVVAGPAAGRTFPLTPGDHVVGRDVGCAVFLDDAALSGRHLRVRLEGGTVTVCDLGSRNGTLLDGTSLEAERPETVAPGMSIAAGRSQLAVVPAPAEGTPPAPSPDGTIRFNRPPRVQRRLDPVIRPFPPPPDAAQRGRLPLGASLIPLALGLGLYLATHIPTMLFFATLSPLMALSTFLEDRRSGRKGFEERRREYRKQLSALRDELEQERRRELETRRDAWPDAVQLLRRARRLEPSLWERRRDDRDFLSLRLGVADRPAYYSVKVDAGGEATLRREAKQLVEWYALAPSVPVELPLAQLGVVGVCGPAEAVDAHARWLVAQAAALHSPRELEVRAALSAERADGWEWLLWLPHTSGAPATTSHGARTLVDDLVRLIDERRESAEPFGGARRTGGPAVLLVLDEAVAPERALVADLLANAAEADVAVVWLARDRRNLPGECAAIVELDVEPPKLAFTQTASGETIADVSADGLTPDLAEELAFALAPVRDTSARAGAGIPERIGLLELLDVDEPAPEWVAERWRHAPDELVASIGVAQDGAFSVDLRGDGPHALVAGMTGAGKSELLQTCIASLAAAHPPSRLSFLLVDYKGGAAFKDCVALPHTVGLVTDLDAHLTQRALVSLNAELQRRERLLRDSGAKDLADMERRDPDAAPASLAIVIDEFATLAKEVPDFIDGIVDVAQRGRSLGVHLVLATQRPSGVVSENIRANTNLRIALRVNEGVESSDVIGAPDAARVPRDRPGRAFARTGHGELTEFQAAYAGAVRLAGADERTILVRRFGFDVPADDSDRAVDGATDLERIVGAVAQAAEQLGLQRPPSPWLPPLEPVVQLHALPDVDHPGREAVVGVVDEPAKQRQHPFVVDLESAGSLLVYGTSGAGKTAFLRTFALALAEETSPDELQLYGLDFATRGLAALESLPHCGSIIAAGDEERTARLFAVLRGALERRKALFAERGVFTLSELRRAAPTETLPRIVVLLDGYAGFASAFERVNLGELVEALPRLVADGRPLGVHFAITADRRGAVPNTLAGIIPLKLVLRMADEDEFSALGVAPRTVRGAHLPPGRGFVGGDAELQVALADVAERAERLQARYGARNAPAIEPLPTDVDRAALPGPSGSFRAALGIGDDELAPVEVNLGERHFLVAGPYRSGRSTALGTIAASLVAGTPGLEAHLLAPRRSPLLELLPWASTADGDRACEDAAHALAARVEQAGGGPPLLLVIDDGDELAESTAAPSLETLVRRGRDVHFRILCACERQAAQRAFGGWLRELRKEENGLLLAPDADVDGDLLAVRLPRRTNPVFPPGRGYLVQRGRFELVQVAR